MLSPQWPAYPQQVYFINNVNFHDFLWIFSLHTGLDLNALVAQDRTWIQFLMESASDNHVSNLLETSAIQVCQL
jgi:hypothetical protein